MDAQPANAFRLSLVAGEVVIEFGNTVRGINSGVAAVAVSDRMVLPLDTGRRLVHWLNDCVNSHETGVCAEPTTAPSSDRAVVRPRPDASGEQASRLLRMVGGLGIPHQYERSLQIRPGELLTNRFLLTVNARDIPGDRVERTLAICDALQMPPAARAVVAANFAMAICVHFGFETDGGRTLGKLYLEREVPAKEAQRARSSGEPALLGIAWKWDVATAMAVTGRYWWHPFLSAAEIQARLADVYPGGPQVAFEIAREALALTRGRVAAERLQYLEVEEAENARRSFDLNLYNAKMQIKDLQPLLDRMRGHFAVRPGQLQALYDQIKAKPVGNIAGGVHRNGEDFFTLYYGLAGLPHYHSGFR
jgi:hypothetical protein